MSDPHERVHPDRARRSRGRRPRAAPRAARGRPGQSRRRSGGCATPRRASPSPPATPPARPGSATVADTTRPAALARTCATLPSAATRPSRSSTTRSANSSASARSWVAKSTVASVRAHRRPELADWRRRPSRPSARRAPAGRGSQTRAAANRTRCFCPPESRPYRLAATSAIPGPAQHVVDRQRPREQRGDQPHDLARGDVVGQAAVLQHGTDEPVGDRALRGAAEHGHRARVCARQPQQHVDHSGLARAVGPEQRYDLTGGDREVDAVDRRAHPRRPDAGHARLLLACVQVAAAPRQRPRPPVTTMP